jgi:hypothetical protein
MQVSVVDGELSPALLSKYQVVVLIDTPLEKQLELNDFSHSKVYFILTSFHCLPSQPANNEVLYALVLRFLLARIRAYAS